MTVVFSVLPHRLYNFFSSVEFTSFYLDRNILRASSLLLLRYPQLQLLLLQELSKKVLLERSAVLRGGIEVARALLGQGFGLSRSSN